jgi:hypothetical protein
MKQRKNCGICKGTDLVKVIDLGEMPLANAFLTKEELSLPEAKYPLRVYFCRTCKSVQLLDIVNPETVFKDYEYLTSASKPLSDHFVKMGQDLADQFITSKDDLVIEIGGNDGVLLGAIQNRCRVLNIDPAKTAAEISKSKGIETISLFFGNYMVPGILYEKGHPKVVVANNVMAHIENIRDVFEGVKQLIGYDGVFVFEVHWLGNLIGAGGFDQIYHEHLYYHSLTALKHLTDSLCMTIFDVQLVPIHGESMRVFVGNREPKPSVREFLDWEQLRGLDSEFVFLSFFDEICNNKHNLKKILEQYNKVVGYGAPAKGNTLLNYFEINPYYIVDTTPGKQGLYTPGRHIPVLPPETLLDDPPNAILILAWNYAESIIRKERFMGLPFIIPVPRATIV